ncbi:MAG TPA: IS110 family transposase [Pseudonocardiaceae bacterium]|nr:IS110 family transposase [Pseudonocardiaceae bacterium]
MFTERTSVGLDVHARSVVAAGLDTVSGQRFRARLCPDHGEICRWLGQLPSPVAVAYEAGPTGFVLARALRAAGIRCEVLAPSRLQRPAGDRVKTDSRDAMHLAKLLRLDEFVPVRVPAADEEAARDLVRAREDARGDVMRARHRVSKLLLRQGIVYYGGGTWTDAHHRWLRQQRLGLPATQIAYEGAYEAVVLTEARRDRLDVAITAMAAEPDWAPMVAKLSCLRGISTLTAFALAVEIGDWYRFTGSSIGAYLGLVPSEFSSGAKRSQGPITKTGNVHARRMLVEAAWHHRRPYRAPGVTLRARWDAAPAAARTRGHAGNTRLHARWECFRDRKKPTVVANVAIARELAGWCWSLATLPD